MFKQLTRRQLAACVYAGMTAFGCFAIGHALGSDLLGTGLALATLGTVQWARNTTWH